MKPICGTLILVLFASLAVGEVAGPQNAQVEAVLLQVQKLARSQQSIQFSFSTRLRMSEEAKMKYGASKSEYLTHSTFMESNGRYRSESEYADIQSNQIKRHVSAYNGKRHQLFTLGDRHLTLSKKSRLPFTSFSLSPVLFPFMFILSERESLSMGALRDPRTWEALADGATWQGLQTTGEQECAVISFPRNHPAGQLEYKVYFAKNLGGYPIRIEHLLDGKKLLGVCRVTDYKTYQTENGLVVVPTRIESVDYDPSGAKQWQSLELTVKGETLRVNEPIPDDLFTIPVSQALILVDVDVGVQQLLDTPSERIMSFDEEQNPPIVDPTDEVPQPAQGEELPKAVDTGHASSGQSGNHLWLLLGICGALLVGGLATIALIRRRGISEKGNTRD